MRCALVVFVKTVGLSPVKTRLAKEIGREKAEQFYLLSCRATFEVIECFKNDCLNVFPYWAVAEPNLSSQPEMKEWREWPNLYQGSGGLGQRLDYVYCQLIEKFDSVIFLGGDCPQISSSILKRAMTEFDTRDFVLGPAFDGGFYLFGGRKKVPRRVWENVIYSSDETLENLVGHLRDIGSVSRELPRLSDVDMRNDLTGLLDVLDDRVNLVKNQVVLRNWIKTQSEIMIGI